MREALTRTLDAIVCGPLFDELGGGVFRYAARRDWTEPSVEKLLSVNATVLRLLLEASVVLDDRRYRDRAKDVLRYAQDVLSNPTTPGFFASQRADDLYTRPMPPRGHSWNRHLSTSRCIAVGMRRW